MFDFNRRKALIAGALSAAALALGACNGAGGSGGAPAEGEMSMGSADAPVTVVEYASVTCAHCAAWNESTWPEFKRRYVDTGRVRYVFRELPTPPQEIAVAGFLLARCAGEDRYFAVIDSIMRNQRAVIMNPRQELLNIARTAGMNEEQFNQCVTDQDAVEALNARVQAASQAGVNGTPYFLINGEHHEDSTLEGFEAALRPLIGGQAPAAPATPATGAETPAAAAEAPAAG
ncbi:MAG: DsbA family protein [Caulobacterales bacterium]|nr:DsbA family protein [Caulobacterales bacterium]